MIRILVSIFNSLFFFTLAIVFFQNGVIAGLVAVFVGSITFFAICLAAMAHRSNNVRCESENPQSREDSSQFYPHVFEKRGDLVASAKR